MDDFAEKIKSLREKLGMSQSELAKCCGVTVRSVSAYETGRAKPRGVTLHKLASALQVPYEYLAEGKTSSAEPYIELARQQYGSRGAAEAAQLLEQNRALFAGGDLSEEAKDDFFRAVMTVYLACKAQAKVMQEKHEE